MSGTQNYQLVIDSRASGQAEIQKLNSALTGTARELGAVSKANEQHASTAERAIAATAKLSAEIYAFSRTAKAFAGEVVALGAVVTAHAGTTEQLVTGYRALRLALSPTLFTATSIGVGILTEAFIRFAYAQGQAVESNALFAAKTGLTLKDVQDLGIVSRATGREATYLATAVLKLNENLNDSDATKETSKALEDLGLNLKALSSQDSAGKLALISAAFDKITDPARRAQIAVTLFGSELAGKILPSLDTSLANNLQRVQAWGVGLSQQGGEGIAKFKREIDNLKRDVSDLGSAFDLAAEKAKNFVIEALIAADPAAARKAGQEPTRATPTFLNDQQLKENLLKGLSPLLSTTTANQLTGLLAATQGNEQALRDAESKYNSSVRGLEQKRSDLIKRRAEFAEALKLDQDGTRPLTDAARAITRTAQVSVDREIDTLGKSIEAAQRAVDRAREMQKLIEKLQPGEYVIDSGRDPYTVKTDPKFFPRVPSLLKGRERTLRAPGSIGGAFVVDQAAYEAANAGNERAIGDQEKARITGEENRQQLDRTRAIAAIQAQADYQARKVALLAGPGGEIQALKVATQIRIDALEKEKALGGDLIELTRKQGELARSYELEILQYKKQQREEARRTGESLFDAAVAGGQGIRSFITAQALAIPRKISGNLAAELFGGSTGKFTLPGVGTAANPTFLGKLLQGTPFGADPLKGATDLNTQATNINTQATIALARAMSGVSGGTASLPGAILGGVTQNPLIFNALSGTAARPGFGINATTVSAPGLNLYDPLNPVAGGSSSGPQIGGYNPNNATYSSTPGRFNLSKAVGYGGIIAGGAFGAYSGFSAGGAQGILTGTSSLSGAAAGILSLAGVTGPAAPILGAVALGLGLASAFMGDPKKRRREELQRETEERRFTEPTGEDYLYSVTGGQVGYDFTGRTRNVTVNNYYSTNIHAVDAPSFVDLVQRSGVEVTKVVTDTVSGGNGDDLVGTIRQAMAL